MAKRVLVNPTIEGLDLGWAIIDVMKLAQKQMSVEEIQEALLKRIIDEKSIEASTVEIQALLDDWLVPDGEVIKMDEDLYEAVTVPCPV